MDPETVRELRKMERLERLSPPEQQGCAHDQLERSRPPNRKGDAHMLVCNCPKCSIIC